MALDAARLAADIKARWLAKPGSGITVANEMGETAVNALCASVAEAVIAELSNATVTGTAGGDALTGGVIA